MHTKKKKKKKKKTKLAKNNAKYEIFASYAEIYSTYNIDKHSIF